MCNLNAIEVGEVLIDQDGEEVMMFVTNLQPVFLTDPTGQVWIMPPLFSWCAQLSKPADSSASAPPATEERSVSGAAFDSAFEKATATPPNK